MSGLMGDGVSTPTKTGFLRSGLDSKGGYEQTPSPPPVEQVTPAKNQVGTTELTNEAGLRASLAARKMSPAEIDRQVEQYKKASGRR